MWGGNSNNCKSLVCAETHHVVQVFLFAISTNMQMDTSTGGQRAMNRSDRQMDRQTYGQRTYGSDEAEDHQYGHLGHDLSIDGPLQLASLGSGTTVVQHGLSFMTCGEIRKGERRG